MQVQSSETAVCNLLKLPDPLQGSGALTGTLGPPAKPLPRLQQPHRCGSGVSRSSPNTDAKKHGAAHLPATARASISGTTCR